MAQRLKDRQSNLIDILHTFLMEYGEPIHYKELTKLLIDVGAWVPYGQQPDQIVYSAMHQDLRKRGDMSAFRLMGKGVFCTSETPGIELVSQHVPPTEPAKPRLARKKPGDTESDYKRRLDLAMAGATCGNCALLEFEGIEEYRQHFGNCNGWPGSGRHCARVGDDPCHKHVRMTAEAHEARAKVKFDKMALLVEKGFIKVPDRMYDKINKYMKERGK